MKWCIKRIFLLGAAILLCATLHAAAVSGIAVSCRVDHAGADGVFRYDIVDDQVVSRKMLWGTTDQNLLACIEAAVINVQGTHVAFLRKVGEQGKLSLVSIEGGEPQNIATTGLTWNGQVAGQVEWPEGDWIYFNHPDWNAIYRVNVNNPNVVETAINVSGAGQWGMSADGNRIHYAANSQTHKAIVNPFQHLGTVGGCGAAISPSGNYLIFHTDPGHVNTGFASWDDAGGMYGKGPDRINCEQYNAWVVNANPALFTMCGSTEIKIGQGGWNNKWSCNSDKWFCLQLSWPPDRTAGCGANQVLVNWVDEKILMVSQNPRSCANYNADICDKNEPDKWAYNQPGDFLVTAPLADVNESLQKYNSGRSTYAASGQAVSFYRGTMDLPQHSRNVLRQIPYEGAHTVSVYNADGARIAVMHGTGRVRYRFLPESAGVYVARIASGAQVSTYRIISRR